MSTPESTKWYASLTFVRVARSGTDAPQNVLHLAARRHHTGSYTGVLSSEEPTHQAPQPGWNWARTHEFQATELLTPSSVDDLQVSIAAATAAGTTLRCVGSRHSFTGIADADQMLDLSQLPEQFDIAPDRTWIRVNGSMIYSRVAELLRDHGLALANLASLPHITVAGATATATHGSGDTNGNLATAVRAVEIATSTGQLRRCERGDDDFGAAAISLGALGAVVSIELDVVPVFEIEQVVHDDMCWPRVEESLDRLFGAAYSMSVFTDWGDHLQLWTKRRVDGQLVDHAALHDGTQAPEKRHPVRGESAEACTDQGFGAGLWSDRLPHFQAGMVPSVGAEVQSEFFVDRKLALDAIDRLRSLGPALTPILMASEIRTVGSDGLWLSPQYQRDCVAFHFTWHHNLDAARHAARLVADALIPLGALPHWGKVFDPSQFDFVALYPRLDDALNVFAAWDPSGTFQTAWMQETFA